MPFKIRDQVQVALVINQYVNPLGFKHLNPNWKLYTIYTCWIASELVLVYFLYVETRGPTLEEITKIFDGGDAKVDQVELDKSGAVVNFSGMEKGELGTAEHRNIV
ncbi:uncharacterized protein A1O9_05057 [Exophiala aquamarina CBS 119918]|uniref:Major facilitator superfamily (MFS) profile domain-containing protein n=1 Tax=Exophiala aquamarina CBS 119918 TaxID=1182545 RepID=A0A072PKC7_9EURO|nr:uncharacterized protein A1O9_05057 [Exophiala aquamarina CBS 119918]KEF60207.1 hypothetical protein A1O9_05057 [Exophiala aquamarina CBS 119918]